MSAQISLGSTVFDCLLTAAKAFVLTYRVHPELWPYDDDTLTAIDQAVRLGERALKEKTDEFDERILGS